MRLSNILSLIALGVSICGGGANFFYTDHIRRKSLKLDHFNRDIRQPIQSILLEMEECLATIERYKEQPVTDRRAFLDALAAKFFGARRKLEWRLQDAQRSSLIPDAGWTSLRDQDGDSASEALERARQATDEAISVFHLGTFCEHLGALRAQVREKLDAASQELMSLC